MEVDLKSLSVLLDAFSLPSSICNKLGQLQATSKSFNSLWPIDKGRNLQSMFVKKSSWEKNWQLVLRNQNIELIETRLHAPFSEHMLRTSRLGKGLSDEQLFLVELHPRKQFTSGFTKLASHHMQSQSQKHRSHLVKLEMQKALKESYTDVLTGIANRRAFEEQLQDVWQIAIKERHPIMLFSVDIDHFKLVNDRLGHTRGDEILQQVAQRLDSFLLRNNDFVARVGGEEFSMVLPNTDLLKGKLLASSTVNAISTLNIPHPESTIADCVTISLGCTSIRPRPEDNLATFIEVADQALYFAKQSGRNCACYMDLKNKRMTIIDKQPKFELNKK